MAILRELTCHYDGVEAICLEAKEDICMGASSGNSGILCLGAMESAGSLSSDTNVALSGYDAPNGSLEKQCLSLSMREMHGVLHDAHCPAVHSGALVIAWKDEERKFLVDLLRDNLDIGETEAKILSASELYERESRIRPGAKGALLVPGETVLDSWFYVLSLAESALQHGGKIIQNAKITRVSRMKDQSSNVASNRQSMPGSLRRITIKPFGQNRVTSVFRSLESPIYDQTASRSGFDGEEVDFLPPLQPIPTCETKGVERDEPSTCSTTIANLVKYARQIVPSLQNMEVVGSYAGLRPATEFRDYQIKASGGSIFPLHQEMTDAQMTTGSLLPESGQRGSALR
eukprot:111145-Hanusia_phi.AAC.1